MAGVLAQTDCSLESLTNSEKSTKLSECRKCADLEQQIHQALNELSSAQLIIKLFNKEHTQDSVDTTVSQQVRTDLEEYDKWKLVMPRCPKVKTGDKYKEMKKVTECTTEQRLILKYPYIVLEEDNNIISNDVVTNSVSETEINDTDSNRMDYRHNSVIYCTTIKEPAEHKKKIATQHNQQNQKRTQMRWSAK
jgi:hypothetical protein